MTNGIAPDLDEGSQERCDVLAERAERMNVNDCLGNRPVKGIPDYRAEENNRTIKHWEVASRSPLSSVYILLRRRRYTRVWCTIQ